MDSFFCDLCFLLLLSLSAWDGVLLEGLREKDGHDSVAEVDGVAEATVCLLEAED
jgi:hypothetical protein